MKHKFEMLGTFCDNCNANLTLSSYISENFTMRVTEDKREFDFCDRECRDEFIKRQKVKHTIKAERTR